MTRADKGDNRLERSSSEMRRWEDTSSVLFSIFSFHHLSLFSSFVHTSIHINLRFIQTSTQLSYTWYTRPHTKGMNISSQVADSEEYKALSSHLANPSNIDATLKQFTNPIYQARKDPSSSTDDLDEHLRRSWNSILLLASQEPHSSPQQDTLATLLQSLPTHPSPTDAGGKEVKVQGGKLWTDLPLFGQQVREAWNFPADKEVDDQTRDKWININAFIARLTFAASSKPDSAPQLDFALYGIWSIRSALEEDMSNLAPNTVNAQVGAAAAWMLYAGAAIKAFCDEEKGFEGKVARAGFKYKSKEWKGYSKERWQVWSEELEKAVEMVSDDGVNGIVREAVESMRA